MHLYDSIVIDQEGILPQCSSCGMRLKSIGMRHRKSKLCIALTAKRKSAELIRQYATATQTEFYVDGTAIENVSEFKYLGRMISSNDRDELAVTARIKTARSKWMQLHRILSADGANCKTMTKFYLAIVQAVLLYGSETWFSPPAYCNGWNDFT